MTTQPSTTSIGTSSRSRERPSAVRPRSASFGETKQSQRPTLVQGNPPRIGLLTAAWRRRLSAFAQTRPLVSILTSRENTAQSGVDRSSSTRGVRRTRCPSSIASSTRS